MDDAIARLAKRNNVISATGRETRCKKPKPLKITVAAELELTHIWSLRTYSTKTPPTLGRKSTQVSGQNENKLTDMASQKCYSEDYFPSGWHSFTAELLEYPSCNALQLKSWYFSGRRSPDITIHNGFLRIRRCLDSQVGPS